MKSPVYVKFEHSEAISAKREMLSVEMGFLNILKKIDTYHGLRKQEFKLKSKLNSKLKKVKKDVISTVEGFPEVPKKLIHTKVEKLKSGAETKKQKNIESELSDIRQKLAQISEK